RAAIIGTGTMGPGMGAVLERAGIEVRLFDIAAEALEKAKGMVEMARGVLDRLGTESTGGGSISFHDDLAAALADVDFVLEAAPVGDFGAGGGAREPRPEAADLRGPGAARRRRPCPLLHPPGDPDPKNRRRPRPPRAGDRHALVDPAAADPDDRGGAGRAHRR